MTGPISTIVPQVTRERAVERFRRRTWRRSLHGGRPARLNSVIEYFIPFHLFRIGVKDGGRIRFEREWAFDAASATLDPLDLNGITIGAASAECVQSAPRTQLSSADVAGRIPDRLRQLVYSRWGSFRLRAPEFSTRLLSPGIYVPYWLGIYRLGSRADFEVLNGLTGSIEGGRLREIVADWLGGA